MDKTNVGQVSTPKSYHDLCSDYDTLPTNIRKILQDAALDFSASDDALRSLSIENLIKQINRITDKETLFSYGPDHPQLKARHEKTV